MSKQSDGETEPLWEPWMLPQVIQARCTLCGLCIAICQHRALVMGDACPLIAQPDACDGCGTCAEICPENAIDCAFEIVWEDEANGAPNTPTQGGSRA